MVFCEENIINPELLDYDPVSIAMMDDKDYQHQLMGIEPDDGLLSEIEDEFDSDIIDDSVCGDSLDMMDLEADEYIESYNDIDDEDGALIDMAIGFNPI